MSKQTELMRQAVVNLMRGTKNTALFQRQVKIGDAVYLQVVSTTGVVTMKTACKEVDTAITALTLPDTWVSVSKGKISIQNPKLAVAPAENVSGAVQRISDEECDRVKKIFNGTSVLAPPHAIGASTKAVLTQANQVCLWLSGPDTKSVMECMWTRNIEDVHSAYALVADTLHQVRDGLPDTDAISVGVLNGHCVVSMRDSDHGIVASVIAAKPPTYPYTITYKDRAKIYDVDFLDTGLYEQREITEEEFSMRTKLTDPSILLQQAAQKQAPDPAPVQEPIQEPVTVEEVKPAEVAVAEVERKFDEAENVHLTETASGDIVTEEYAETESVEPEFKESPGPVEEPAAEPEQIAETPEPAESIPAETPAPEQEAASVMDLLDQLQQFLSDFKQYAVGGEKGVKTIKKLYKAEVKELQKAAKESAELVALKAENAKLKTENARLKAENDKLAPVMAALKSFATQG